MKHADITGFTNSEARETFKRRIVAIGDSQSDLASSNHREDREDVDDKQTEQGKLSEDDISGWLTGTITRTVPQQIEMFRQNQMKLEELTQPGWEDVADYFGERDKKVCNIPIEGSGSCSTAYE
jgi:hypothetical protein